MTSLNANSKNDNYRTPKMAWEMVSGLFPKTHKIYEPFYCKGASKEYWSEIGHDVIHEDEDFFEHCEQRIKECDIIVSNPPYSIKKRVFEKLKELNKPFIMLVPIEILGYKYFQELFANQIQVVIPPKRIHFTKITEQDGTLLLEPKSQPFHVIFVCYKCDIGKDLLFLENK